MRNLHIETLSRVPISKMQMKIVDRDPEFTPLVTDDEDESQENDEPWLTNMTLIHPRVLSKAGNMRKAKKSRSSAAIFLDEPGVLDYGEFDIMDRQRPSIQLRRNARSRRVCSEPCDTVFANRMQRAWEGDRAKKKLRKQAREDLRQLGLLDKKGKISLKSKYTQGLSLGDLEEQIQIFLQSSKER